MKKVSARKQAPVNPTPSEPEVIDMPPGEPANDAPPRPPAAIEKFPFHGDMLDVATTPDGEHYVVLARLCEPLGISDVKSQIEKLKSLPWACWGIIPAHDASGRNQELFCLNIRSVAGWLFTINAGKVAAHLREKLALYQRECADVLADHFLGRRGTVPAVDTTALVTQILTAVTSGITLAFSELRTELREAGTAGAGISAWQADDLRRRIDRVAHGLVCIGDRANLGSARSHIHRKIQAATGWGFRGSQIATMPAHMLPTAIACLRGVEMDLKHRFQQRGEDPPAGPAQGLLPGLGDDKKP